MTFKPRHCQPIKQCGCH